MTLTHGGLFEGYGGTTMAAELALGPLETRWISEVKPAAITLQRYRNPDVPNLGDMRFVHYGRVEPVDVLTASWPCQPHSSAGKRLGEADHRALWPYVAKAIEHLRPPIFLVEALPPSGTWGPGGCSALPTLPSAAATSAPAASSSPLTLLPTPAASSYGTNQGGAAGRTGPVRESLDMMARRGRIG